jgi:4-hydroxybutyrate CoA-transferase
VFVHGGAATPALLLDALVQHSERLKNVELIHLHTEGMARYAAPEFRNSFRVANLFVGSNMRTALNYDTVDYLPCFLSEIPQLLRSKRRPVDVALLHLSPPDRHGFCTLGVSVDVARAAFEGADLVLAQINHRMPRVHGDGFIHIDDVDHFVEVEAALPHSGMKPASPQEEAIGKHVANLVEDGACLQVGIGTIPDAVLRSLRAHKNLGVHTEMWSDGMLELIRSDAVDNSKKAVHAGKNVSSFIIGSQAVYDFIHDNPSVVQFGADYINNPNVISRNDRVTAVNSAVEVDLTGQVCADSIGHQIISGVGGQMDFIRGAALSRGGKPIIALTSRTRKGVSRFVSALKAGAGVVTTRAHVHYVVTEYGVADLYGKTLNERAQALISIAHPDDRESLCSEWDQLRKSGSTRT